MKKLLLLLFSLTLSFIGLANASTLCPNGTYVGGNTCTLCPNGQYVGGQTCQLTPNGGYVGGDFNNNNSYGNSNKYGGMTGSTYGQSYMEGAATGTIIRLLLSNSNSSNGDAPKGFKPFDSTKSYSSSNSSNSFYKSLSKIIPINSYQFGGGWKCKAGYERYRVYVDKSIFDCRNISSIPENAYSTGSYSSGDGWDCKGGYEKYNNGCRKKSDPENSYSLSEDIPLNSHKSGGGWECNTGYSQYGNKCVAKSTSQETKVIQNESSNYLEEIKQAKELLDSGVITEDEFKDIKKKIIDNI